MKKSLILLVLMPFLSIIINAQTNCPPTLNDPTWPQNSEMYGYEPMPYDVWGWVFGKSRNINGRIEVKIDWNTLVNHNKYGLTNDEFKKMMYKAIMAQIVGGYNCNFVGTKHFVFFEETKCKVSKKCYLKVSKDSDVLCADIGWPGPNPSFFEYQTEKYLPIYGEEECGIQCCEINYIVECTQRTTGGGTYVHIVNKYKTPVPGAECSTSNSFDCLTGAPESCNSTCY